MKIDSDIKAILEKIDFANRYKSICNDFNDFDNRLLIYNVDNITDFLTLKGWEVKYVKKGNFFKFFEKIGDYSLQLNTVMKRGFLQFVFSVKFKGEKLNMSYGIWEAITRELSGFESGKPIFKNYKDLELIIERALLIYGDFKSELSKIAQTKNEQNQANNTQVNKEINITKICKERGIISVGSDEKKFYLEEHVLNLNGKEVSILIEDSKIIMELKEKFNNDILELVLSQTNAKKNMLGGYDSIDGFSLRYLLIENYLLVISSGETQPHLFKLFLEGCWKIDNINNTEVV